MADAPPTGAAAVASQLKDLWGRQPRGKKTLALAVALGIAGLIAYTTLAHHAEPWTTVAEGVSPDDAQELLVLLEGRNLPVRLRDGKVEVATDRLEDARAIAASAGMPRTGKGLELFDASSLGQSSFVEQVNYRRALQGELARSITALAQVENARVLIAFGKRSLARDQEQPASASVALHLHAGQTLSADQVRGVRQLVAASIEGLRPDAVVIVDNHGNLLDGADPGAVDRKAELERTVTSRVRTMLERVVGPGKVSVVTTADVDDRKVSETQEVYDADHPALRSESRTIEGGDATQGIGGIAGTRGNLPGAPPAGPIGAGQGSSAAAIAAGQRLQETKNYEVSRTVRQTTKPDVLLQRLHVAVVVDYKAGTDGKPVAPSDKELAELTAVARQAAGVDDARGDKIEVHAIPFASDPDAIAAAAATPAASGVPLIPLAGAGAGALVLAIVVALALRRRRQPQRGPTLALPAPVAELERVLQARPTTRAPTETGIDPTNLLPGRTVRDRVLDAVRSDVDRTAGVLTAWLAEPPRKGAK